MRKVQRQDIVDYVTYEERRPALRERVMAVKSARRVHAGDELTFLFENHETVAYQVQEMMRAERIVREADIQHEIDTYNELIGGDGELGFTLLIEIPDPVERKDKLARWKPLVDHVFAELPGGRRVHARYDRRQIADDKLSSVHYMVFDTGGETPVAVGCDWEGHPVEARLTDAQRAALEADLGS
ncbi:MAG: DUF3501 family protein [Myxococcales bacterium]|nr:DUF3501 family protein [Myxococcales bacterium]MCB9732920.1 DUF3501 family protein [Deltaproteobacteria bacterium]